MPLVPWPEMYEAMKAIALEEAQRAYRYEMALERIAAPGSMGRINVTDVALEALGRPKNFNHPPEQEG